MYEPTRPAGRRPLPRTPYCAERPAVAGQAPPARGDRMKRHCPLSRQRSATRAGRRRPGLRSVANQHQGLCTACSLHRLVVDPGDPNGTVDAAGNGLGMLDSEGQFIALGRQDGNGHGAPDTWVVATGGHGLPCTRLVFDDHNGVIGLARRRRNLRSPFAGVVDCILCKCHRYEAQQAAGENRWLHLRHGRDQDRLFCDAVPPSAIRPRSPAPSARPRCSRSGCGSWCAPCAPRRRAHRVRPATSATPRPACRSARPGR